MSLFNSYNNVDNAPEKSQKVLNEIQGKYGTIINIFADMAESPLPIELYLNGQDQLMQRATLGAEKVNLVQLAVSVENVCEFCVPAHSWAANSMKTDKEIVNAIRDGRDGPDNSINALVDFTRAMVRERGKLSDAQVQEFLDAGFTKEQVFEVLSVISYKTITNYTSALAGTQPNDFMNEYAWSPEQDAKRAA